jgi:hypothetical protein
MRYFWVNRDGQSLCLYCDEGGLFHEENR